MYRLMPFRRHSRGDFLPQGWDNFFNWPESFWQGFSGFGFFNVDVKETEEGCSIQSDLPGVAKDNIRLSLYNGSHIGRILLSSQHLFPKPERTWLDAGNGPNEISFRDPQ